VTEAAPPVAELLNLGGRVALMTGASGGVGAGIARRRGEVGAGVVVHYRCDADGAAAVVDTMGSGRKPCDRGMCGAPRSGSAPKRVDSAAPVPRRPLDRAPASPAGVPRDAPPAGCSSLQSVAVPKAPVCRQIQSLAVCCRLRGWTLNPKVEGSNPSRPMTETAWTCGPGPNAHLSFRDAVSQRTLPLRLLADRLGDGELPRQVAPATMIIRIVAGGVEAFD
jgi:hypothetical protein